MKLDRTIRTIIVDDEDLARQVIREMLKTHPEIEIVGECANGFDAVKAVTELSRKRRCITVQNLALLILGGIGRQRFWSVSQFSNTLLNGG